jgi:transaldolase
LLSDGLIYGVTTNPTVLARSSLDFAAPPALYAEWVAAGENEIIFQAWGPSADDLERSGRTNHALGERVVVKVTASAEGFRAAARLTRDGANVLLTAVYSPGQAAAAAAILSAVCRPLFRQDSGLGTPRLRWYSGNA